MDERRVYDLNEIIYATSQKIVGDKILLVTFSDGSKKQYDAVALGCQWFKMSNDCFFNLYGFNFNPSQFGLYEICRKLVYGK